MVDDVGEDIVSIYMPGEIVCIKLRASGSK